MPVFPGLFCVYWLSVLLWSLMAERLCAGLSLRHPLLWAGLGRAATREVAILQFLLRRRDRFLEDRSLVRLCSAMRALFVAFVVFFLTVPALLAS